MSSQRICLVATLLLAANNSICVAQVEQGAITGAVTDFNRVFRSRGQSYRQKPGYGHPRRYRDHC